MSDAPSPMDDRLRAAFGALEDADLSEPPAPPPEVWEAIAAAVDDEAAGDTATPRPSPASRIEPPSTVTTAPSAPPSEPPPPSGIRRGRPRGASHLRAALLAAAAILVVLMAGTVVVRMRQTTVTEVAVLNDDGLPNRSNVRGRAELVDDAGRKVLDVVVPDLPEAANGQAFEVWLLAADGGLQSLGLIEHTGRFAVPAGVDITKFNIVDVSREPIDGNPTHSGDSVVRGTLVPR